MYNSEVVCLFSRATSARVILVVVLLGGASLTPTIYRERGYRFFFFSREEPRMHVHVSCPDGEAKFWLEPQIELAKNYRLSRAQVREVEDIIEERHDEFRAAWHRHFEG